jgi:hypothetical protein
MELQRTQIAMAILLASLPLSAVAADADTPQAIHDKLVANSPAGDPTGQGQTGVDTINTVVEATVLSEQNPFESQADGLDNAIAAGVAGAPDGPLAGGSDPDPDAPEQSDVQRDRFDSANVFMDNGDAVSQRLIDLSPEQNPIKSQMQGGRDTVVDFARSNIVDGINNGAGGSPGANTFWSQTDTNTTPPNGMKAGEDAFATLVDQGVFGAVNGVINLPAMAAGGETNPEAYAAAVQAIPTALQTGATAALFAFENPNITTEDPVVADGGVADAILLTATGVVPGAADTCFFTAEVSDAGVELDFGSAASFLDSSGKSAEAQITVLCGDKDDANKALRLSTAPVGDSDVVSGSIGGETTSFTLLAEDAPLASFSKTDFQSSNNVNLSATYDKSSTAGRKGGLVAFAADQYLYVRVE